MIVVSLRCKKRVSAAKNTRRRICSREVCEEEKVERARRAEEQCWFDGVDDALLVATWRWCDGDGVSAAMEGDGAMV